MLWAALFFSPAVGSLRSVTTDDSYRFHVNVFNRSFNIGAAIGIFGWQISDDTVGWRSEFLIASALTLAVSAIYFPSLRAVEEERAPRTFSDLRAAALDPLLWIFATFGFASVISENVAGQFIVYYPEKELGYPNYLASYFGTAFLVSGFLGWVIGGLIARTYGMGIRPLALLIASTGLLLVAIPLVHSPYLIFTVTCMIGFASVEGNWKEPGHESHRCIKGRE